MKKLILLLLTIPLLLSGTPSPTNDEVGVEFFGIWKTFEGEYVQITRNMDYEVIFQRVSNRKQLLAKGKLNDTFDGKIEIEREYPDNTIYTSEYVFSPSGKTLVIMKPDGKQAWLLEKIQSY